jgi:putative transcriptional regulator
MQTRIREYRTRVNLTQEDLARAAGVRRETIVFLEQGKYNPSLRLAHAIARALHTTIDELFIFDEDTSGPEERIVLGD